MRLIASQASLLRMPLYLVGGVVRDILLKHAVNDFDLVAEGDATELAKLVIKKFGGQAVFHSRFGTAKWILDESVYQRLRVPAVRADEVPASLDLISARSEIYSEPGALPTVTMSTLKDDLRRRDFTINAMALRLDGNYFGELIDPLGGESDLRRGLIRVFHQRSFLDDPTRLLRAVRYQVRYGFELEAEPSI